MATAIAAGAAAPPPTTFSTSTSSFRASQSNNGPTPPSYSDTSNNNHHHPPLMQLPRVDFNFDDLRARMSAFTAKFDAFIEQGRKRVLAERNEFRGRLGELGEDRRTTSTRITTLSSTLTSHAHLVAREVAEKAEMQAAIAGLGAAHTETAAAGARLRTGIAGVRRQIEAKRAAQAQYAAKVEGQAGMNGPELAFWEEYLGVRVEGSGRADVVRVVFAFEGPAVEGGRRGGNGGGGGGERDQEGVCELKVPERGGYEVVYSKPRLEEKRVQGCVERLNESRDLGAFLKGMRGLFGEVLR